MTLPAMDVELLIVHDGSVDVPLPGADARRATLRWEADTFHGEIWVDDQQVAHVTFPGVADLVAFVSESHPGTEA